MSSKFRLKLLQKIAQVAEQGSTTETTGTPTVSGSPTDCSIVSYFQSAPKAWGANNLNYMQSIVNYLNNGIYVLSQGQMDFNNLRVQNFNVDTSKYPDRVLKNIVIFSKLVYNVMLTDNGKDFAVQLTPETKGQKLKQLNGAVTTGGIPDGVINQFLSTKIGGNLKDLLVSNLSNIK